MNYIDRMPFSGLRLMRFPPRTCYLAFASFDFGRTFHRKSQSCIQTQLLDKFPQLHGCCSQSSQGEKEHPQRLMVSISLALQGLSSHVGTKAEAANATNYPQLRHHTIGKAMKSVPRNIRALSFSIHCAFVLGRGMVKRLQFGGTGMRA